MAWILGAGGGDIGDVMRLSAVAWLATHLAPLALEEGAMSVLPLALVLLPASFLWRAGRWAARRSGCCTWADAKPMIIAGTAAYATTGLLLSAVSTSEGASVRAWWALLATALVAFVAFSAGLIREAGLASTLTDRLNPRVRALGLAVSLGCAAIIAGGAVLLAISMMWHFTTALSMVDALSPGLLGNVMLLLLSILYVPNAIVWASSYSTGAGFTFGEGAWIAPLSTASEPVPAFPLLAAIPTGAGPALALVMIIPLLAGALMMRCFARSTGNSLPLVTASALRTRLTMAGAVAAIMGVCCLLAGGSLGDGRLAQVGPVAWQCAVFAGLLALVGGWLADAVASMGSRRSNMRV